MEPLPLPESEASESSHNARYSALSTEDEDDPPCKHVIPELLGYYQGLELDEELQMATDTQQDMANLWELGSRAYASRLESSRWIKGLVFFFVVFDVTVTINLEPNPPQDQQISDFEVLAYWLDVTATAMFTVR